MREEASLLFADNGTLRLDETHVLPNTRLICDPPSLNFDQILILYCGREQG